MASTRLVIRWILTLLAAALTLVALLTVVLRLALGQADLLTPRLEALLSARFEASVTLEGIDGGLDGADPRLAVRGLQVRSRPDRGDRPLLEVEAARLRLDAPASLRQGLPVVADARLTGLTLHLYQGGDGRWHWPEPADIPPELVPEREFDLARLDFWVGVLLRQRAWAEDLRVVLHGRQREAVLTSPRLLMVGDARRVHLEGEAFLGGRPARQALRVAMEVVPGAGGLEDFGAALQADMDLASLTGLSSLLGVEALPRLDDAEGEARLWARWTHGRLADVRLDLGAPRLALRQSDPPSGQDEGAEIVLEGTSLRGQWRREAPGEDWQAWFQGDVRRVSGLDASGDGPPLPRDWHLRRLPDGWWLNTSGFDLSALAAWRRRLPLPEGLSDALAKLSPRGRVTALGLGRRDGQWQARVSATDVAVDPWRHAPGGGPLDLWITVEGKRGRVRFVDGGEASLVFPRIFGEPMALARAEGVVSWVYAGRHTRVSGRDLRVGWQEASVEGDFGLSLGGPGRGGLGLALDLHDVDALARPLTDWLPMPLLRERTPELADWLAEGVAGRVPEGSLRLHVPLRRPDGDLAAIAPRLALDLAVEEGRLRFAPGWPALEEVAGRLRLADGRLTAEVDRAESLGVQARDGQVRLADRRLEVEAPLTAEAGALARYLAAMPVEGGEVAADWQGDGALEAGLDLNLTLGKPDSLALDIAGDASLERLMHAPSGLVFSDLSGPVAWRQQGGSGALEGEVAGRLLGGPVTADLGSEDGRLDFSGTATAASLIALGAPTGVERILSGRIPWEARLTLAGRTPTLMLESELRGLAIELPAPLGKSAATPRALRLETTLGDESRRLSGRLGSRLGWRWRPADGGQGQVWLGREAPATWPAVPGWSLQAYLPRLVVADWAEALEPLTAARHGQRGPGNVSGLTLDTDCLSVEGRCLGSLIAEGEAVPGGWNLSLDGSLLAGRLDYREGLDRPLDVALSRLRLDGLLPVETGGSGRLLEEVAVPPDPAPMPDGLAALPAGRLRIAELGYRGRWFGPLTAYWRTTPERLVVDPLGLTLGEISAHGNLAWEATGPRASLTRARLALDGRDLGTALAALGEPMAIRNAETRVDSQLAWPGAPWQFALSRSRGSVDVSLRDGRFVNLESPSARVIGLLNVDNLLRRLTLDFSDVTGRGTAFDRVTGGATLYGGVLETRGPVEIEGPATRFTLDGSVDLVRRELDQRLGVTVPVSNNLPLAAVIAGAPVVGGALFIADKLFGDALDRVTRIHYRVEGPWTSPRIALESAE